MDGDDIFWLVMIGMVVITFGIIITNAVIDTGAYMDCVLEGYDGGFSRGVAFGNIVCFEDLADGVIEYFNLN